MKTIPYILKALNRYDAKIIPYSAAIALLGVAVPFAGIFLPKLILDLLESASPPSEILLRGGAYTLMLATLYFLNDFCKRNKGWRQNHITNGNAHDILFKNLDCEYNYLENPEAQSLFARVKQNVDSDESNCYIRTIRALTGIVTGCLGFVLYSFVLSGLNIWVVLLLTATAAANYFTLRAANRYEHSNKDNWAPLEKKIAYLLKVSGDYEYGKDIRMYNMEPWFMSIARGLFSERASWDNRVQNHHFISKAVNALTVLLRDGAAYALLIYMVTQGRVGVADFILFFGAIAGFSAFVTAIIESVSELGGALPYVKDMLKYMNEGCVKEPENCSAMPKALSSPSIEFRNVSFSYAAEKKILDGLSFTIKAGEKAAIVGLNGAGKTTLVKLLCGFYTPDEGEILINGEDISNYRKQDLFKLFSTVFQDEFIMPFTIAENIAPNSKDESGMRRSLERAGILELIDSFPKGLQSLMTKTIREDGVILSGGQRQKLFLARALYKDAPILVLDEPTAALDPIAESEIYEKYHELSGGKTSIFISHRLASTRFCDTILLVGNGRILESGSHGELIAKGGEYANMYEIQSHYYKEDMTHEAI